VVEPVVALLRGLEGKLGRRDHAVVGLVLAVAGGR
jgi:hypothetical protein